MSVISSMIEPVFYFINQDVHVLPAYLTYWNKIPVSIAKIAQYCQIPDAMPDSSRRYWLFHAPILLQTTLSILTNINATSSSLTTLCPPHLWSFNI